MIMADLDPNGSNLGAMVTIDMETIHGPVKVRYIENEGGSQFIALPGMGGQMAQDMWNDVAPKLALDPDGLNVFLPDPYSNRKTKPHSGEFAVVKSITTLLGYFPGECREKWLSDLCIEGQKIIMCGHSWGGGAAARFAGSYPEKVKRLVLISPDVQTSVARRTFKIPTLLIWAKNDYINPYYWRTRWNGHPKLTLHSTEKGGHTVLPEHAAIIKSWLKEQDRMETFSKESNNERPAL